MLKVSFCKSQFGFFGYLDFKTTLNGDYLQQKYDDSYIMQLRVLISFVLQNLVYSIYEVLKQTIVR